MKAILIDHFVKVSMAAPFTFTKTSLTCTQDLTELTPKDVPSPKPKSADELTIKITHAAITHVDLLYAQGQHQNNKRHIQPPFILGNEFSGIVTSAPPSSSFQAGTKVFGGGLGSYAESICVPESAVRRIPVQWSLADACAVGASGAVSYGALVSVAQVKRGDSVLVLGASGGLGVMAVQIAKALGARVIAVVGSEEKASVVKKIGADYVVNYRVGKWEEQVKQLTKGEGVDVVYDGIGAVESGIRCLKYRGRLVIVGFAARGGNVEGVKANRILLKSAMVHGYRFGEDGRHDPQRTRDVWDGFMRLVEQGNIEPVIYEEDYRGLESVSKALEDAKSHKSWGRAVMRIAEESDKARL
jgi:NADPH:quinone reductase-like Zn-dependent oxidoreductase